MLVHVITHNVSLICFSPTSTPSYVNSVLHVDHNTDNRHVFSVLVRHCNVFQHQLVNSGSVLMAVEQVKQNSTITKPVS